MSVPHRLPAMLGIALLAATACSGGVRTRSLEGRLTCLDCGEPTGGVVPVDFGLVTAGRTAERTVRLRNDGAGSLRIELLPLLPPFSSDAPARANLEPRAEISVTLRFSPTGDQHAAQDFHVGVSSGKALILRLTGEGGKPRIACEPALLDFGVVVVGSRATRAVHCRNLRKDLDAELVAGTAAPFRAASADVLPAGSDGEVLVDFVPTDVQDRAEGRLHLGGTGMDPVIVQLHGTSILTGLTVDPPPPLARGACYDLGEIKPGDTARLHLTLSNRGNAAIWLQTLVVDPPGPFRAEASLPLQLPTGGGASTGIDLVYAPTRVSTSDSATVVLAYTEAAPSTFTTCVRARASGPAVDCDPRSLDFGSVRLGTSNTKQVECTNTGTEGEVLEISGMTAAAPFRPVSEDIPPTKKDDFVTLDVAYDAVQPGEFSDVLRIETNAGMVSIPVKAQTRGESCLVLGAPALDFGSVEPGCRSPLRVLELWNRCLEPVEVEQLEMTPTTSSFTLSSAPPEGSLIPGGGVVELAMLYEPRASGAERATITLLGQGDPFASAATLTGDGSGVLETTDVVHGGLAARSDVLVVMDNSGSMKEERPAIEENLPVFLDALISRSVDFHLALTTTGTTSSTQTGSCPGGVGGLENGRFFPADGSSPRILTSRMSTEDLRASWRKTIDVGTCREMEQGLSAASRALDPEALDPLIDVADDPTTNEPADGNAGFLRANAGLVVLFVTDDDDKSSLEVGRYLSSLRTVKGLSRSDALLRVHSIDGGLGPTDETAGGPLCADAAAPGTRYQEVVRATGGLRQDICQHDWSDMLQGMVEGMREAPRCHALEARPAAPAGGPDAPSEAWFDVRVNGVPVAPGSGEDRVWYYDRAAQAICFSGLFAPQADDELTMRYAVACR